MNHSYFNNDAKFTGAKFTGAKFTGAKFTGSAFESPSDAATVLFQVVLLLLIAFGLVPENRI